jgi:hypothetical protein
MEPRGVEPLTRQCHCRVIPLHYGPKINFINKIYFGPEDFVRRAFYIYLLTFAILKYKIVSVNLNNIAGVAEWQTRQPQKLLRATSWGFKSLLRHHKIGTEKIGPSLFYK